MNSCKMTNNVYNHEKEKKQCSLQFTQSNEDPNTDLIFRGLVNRQMG